MTNRFYTPQLADKQAVRLTGREAHHLIHVLRLKAGQDVVLFDGRGLEADGEIVSLARSTVEVRVAATRRPPAEKRQTLTLATAVPKGERFRWLVEKATELGVDRLIPLKTARSVVVPKAGKLDKMKQTVIAAGKQSGRNRLMEIDAVTGWDEFLENEANVATILIADQSGEPIDRCAVQQHSDRPMVTAIGPEGGFTETELQDAASAGAQLVLLAPHVLRTETAAIALAAYLALHRLSGSSSD